MVPRQFLGETMHTLLPTLLTTLLLALSLTCATPAMAGKWDNLVVMREKAKTDAFKKTQYAYYLDKYGITDADVVAYGQKAGAIPLVTPPAPAVLPAPLPTDPALVGDGTVQLPEVPPVGTNGRSWRMFRGFRYQGMPDLAGCGLESIKILYQGELFGTGSRARPNIAQLKGKVVPALLKADPEYVVIDIEHWDEVTEIDKLITVVRTLKQAVRAAGNTRMKFGYYMLVPIRNWNAPVLNKPGRMDAWKAQNDRMARLAAEVDVLFPSLYTQFNEPANWVKYAEANIAEARQYGKPVFLFLWPQFHNYNKSIGTRYLPISYWQLQLDTAKRLADGVVIWGSIRPNAGAASIGWDDWNKSAPWWQLTKDYARRYSTAGFGTCNEG